MKVGYIYKITSPKNRVYIGQTLNVNRRFKQYARLDCKKQIKLYNSLIKHGVYAHNFEVINECEIKDLSKFERFYQELFNCLSKSGLNLCFVSAEGKRYVMSDETKEKMRPVYKRLSDHNRKNGLSFFNKDIQRKALESRLANPRVLSEKAKDNLRVKNTGKIKDELTKQKISLSKKGIKTGPRKYPMTEEHKENLSKSKKGRFFGDNNKLSRLILNMETGIYYVGSIEATASQSKYKNKDHINSMLSGIRLNKTQFQLV